MPDFDIYIRQQADGPNDVDAEPQLDATREAALEHGFTPVPIHEEAEEILRNAETL